MKWLMPAAFFLAMFSGFNPAVAGAQAPQVRGTGDEVWNVFASKCAGCHGPDVAKPKGRFGYVLDLRRVARNPEMVIPYRPDKSELWLLVKQNEMPPANSPHGALAPAQKEVIRSWIAAGAPDASAATVDARASIRSELASPAPMELASADRILRLLGKLHLLLVHFPIALVVAAGVGEVLSVWHRNPLPSESVRYCLRLSALAVIPTVGLGWLFAAAGNGAGSPELLTAHRWLGTTAAVWLVITAVCAERDACRGARSHGVRLLLGSGVVITALAAHLGGLLGRGADFFTY